MKDRNEKQGSLYLITGILVGVLLGFALSQWVFPVKYINTEPYTLNTADKKTYRVVVAKAFLVEADYDRAVTRLNLLGDANSSEILVAQAQSMVNTGVDDQARALALLASVLSNPSTAITPLSPVKPTHTAAIEASELQKGTAEAQTSTPSHTSTPRPTLTPQATQGAPFELIEQNTICDPIPSHPLLQIIVLDAADEPVAGEPIEISPNDGSVETFYTGFYPEISSGYADYAMQPGEVYAIRVGQEGRLIPNLYIPTCALSDGTTSAGSLELIFKQK